MLRLISRVGRCVRVRKAEHALKVDIKRRRMIVKDARAQEEKASRENGRRA